MIIYLSVARKVFRLSRGGHDGRGRNPAFSGRGDTSSGKKAGFLCRPAYSPETFRSADSVKAIFFNACDFVSHNETFLLK
ncbi:Uncharacterized protein dnm_086790 [Desulfonema magnum]|uniref:Uncharacterized protein n=1 Tax=Desulfonema magnum TaxID=45655 RepID=A0A975GT10_9BACT|nr:Uncharacterized protein dnm_086790 [Desulfonema magnum]